MTAGWEQDTSPMAPPAVDDHLVVGQEQQVALAAEQLRAIVDNIGTVILGKGGAVELVVLTLIAGGHVLIEDVPGVGKTSLVSALARSISCDFKRIQFTPDVMPSDITGFSMFNQVDRAFEFRPGGVMSNIVLADEINRASAKTQAALLEAMEERQVTVDSDTYQLPEPFMVLATQNPIESFGTYPLPEAQIDRFLIKISIGYPEFGQEMRILEIGRSAKESIRPVATGEDIIAIRQTAAAVKVSPLVTRYIVEIVTATRSHPDLRLGASPRGSLALENLARAFAVSRGRDYVLPDDVKYLAPFALSHRISLSHEAKISGRTAQDVIGSILGAVAVPHDEAEELRVRG